MNWSADSNTTVGRTNERQPKHLGTVALHQQVPEHARVGIRVDTYTPPKSGPQSSLELGIVDSAVRPLPEVAVQIVMITEQPSGNRNGLIETFAETFEPHAILNCQCCGFIQFP